MNSDRTLKRLDRRLVVAAVAIAGMSAAMLFGVAANDAQAASGKQVRVMTRNLYLGSDLGPGLNSMNLAELSAGAGEILRSVDVTKFSDRAKQLAKEIRSQNPDLVGLQEVALWRTKTPPVIYLPVPNGPPPTATKVRYDFLEMLLAALNKGKGKSQRYSAAVTKNEFDFETPGDLDDNPATNGCPLADQSVCDLFPGADLTGRLTMRDVILVKSGVKVSQKASGTFGDRNDDGDAADDGDVPANLYTPEIAGGVSIPVTRGWTALTAKVRGSKPFRFVNVHLEAFGDPEQAKCLQAQELYDRVIGPSSLPVLALGDFNSDDDTVDGDNSTPGVLDGTGYDRCAYLSLISDGMRSLTSINAVQNTGGGSCCLNASLLDKKVGYASDFDHQVDHILTDSTRFTKVGPTKITGNTPFRTTGSGPYWGSDHAGIAQAVKIK